MSNPITIDELRSRVFAKVAEVGPVAAKEFFYAAIDEDFELMVAFARHGKDIVNAFVEREGEKIQ